MERTRGRSNRQLLSHHDAEAALAAPPVSLALSLRLIALAHQLADFFFHHQSDQLHPGLANQFAYALAQPAHRLGQGQHHLHRWIAISGHLFQPFHGSLRFNLMWFLHSDSLLFFLAEKLLRAYQSSELESRYFLRSTGHSPGMPDFPLKVATLV